MSNYKSLESSFAQNETLGFTNDINQLDMRSSFKLFLENIKSRGCKEITTEKGNDFLINLKAAIYFFKCRLGSTFARANIFHNINKFPKVYTKDNKPLRLDYSSYTNCLKALYVDPNGAEQMHIEVGINASEFIKQNKDAIIIIEKGDPNLSKVRYTRYTDTIYMHLTDVLDYCTWLFIKSDPYLATGVLISQTLEDITKEVLANGK